jgi:Phosphoinositide phospholipase C, Ca2+-dependent
MRFWLVATVTGSLLGVAGPALAGCNLSAPDASHAGGDLCVRPWLDANMHINQLQYVGTAESYKLAPSEAMLSLIRMGGRKDAEALDFAQPPLADQLNAGARSLEFDVAYDPNGGQFKNPAGASMASELLDPGYVEAMSKPGFKVIHVLDVDFHSSCVTFKDCLTEVATWSRAHRRHLPILIALHANDARTPMPGATKPVPFDADAFAALDAEIRAIFQPDELITPDQIKGTHADLREAILAGAWPRLGEARGKVMFLLDDKAQKTDLYTGPAKSLQGRPMFVATDEQSPLAAFICIEDPLKDQARIAGAVESGFIVKTRADADTREARDNKTARRDAAFASGAQIVATDFLMPDKKIGSYQVNLTAAGGHAAQCDVKLPGEQCVSWAARQPPQIAAVAH